MSIGINIKKARMNKSLSQEELGKKIGLTKASVSRIEAGIVDPQSETLYKIAMALGCNPVDFLQEGTDIKNEDIKAFWERVKSTCNRSGISQKELYGISGLDPKVVFHWSNVAVLPSTDAILKFAAYLNVDVYWLLYGNAIPNAHVMKETLEAKKELNEEAKEQRIRELERELAQLKGE